MEPGRPLGHGEHPEALPCHASAVRSRSRCPRLPSASPRTPPGRPSRISDARPPRRRRRHPPALRRERELGHDSRFSTSRRRGGPVRARRGAWRPRPGLPRPAASRRRRRARRSRRARRRRAPRPLPARAGRTAATRSRFSVSVPVLSTHAVVISPDRLDRGEPRTIAPRPAISPHPGRARSSPWPRALPGRPRPRPRRR